MRPCSVPRPPELRLSLCRSRWPPAARRSPADENLDSLDAELTNTVDANQPGKDPALMSALQSQIMVDPALAQQANADAARPADQPYAAQVPAEGIAARQPEPAAGRARPADEDARAARPIARNATSPSKR